MKDNYDIFSIKIPFQMIKNFLEAKFPNSVKLTYYEVFSSNNQRKISNLVTNYIWLQFWYIDDSFSVVVLYLKFASLKITFCCKICTKFCFAVTFKVSHQFN